MPRPEGEGGAQLGNQHARRGTMWRDAVRKCIVQGGSLDKLAKVLVAKALEGDMVAMREIGDRLDGKAVQAIEVGDTEEMQLPNEDTLAAKLAAVLASRASPEDGPVH